MIELSSIPEIYSNIDFTKYSYHMETSKNFQEKVKLIQNKINSLFNFANLNDNIFHKLKTETDNLQKDHFFNEITENIKDLKNIFEKVIENIMQENDWLMSKKDLEIDNLKRDIIKVKQSQLENKINLELKRSKWKLKKQDLMNEIQNLYKQLDENRKALKDQTEHFSQLLKIEKQIKRKMESWFKRRLETLEFLFNQCKDNPNEHRLFEKLLNKLNKLKNKRPWRQNNYFTYGAISKNNSKNLHNKNNFILQDLLNNDSKIIQEQISSSGTSTPFSHYTSVISDNAYSENKTINKAFIESALNSQDINDNINTNHHDNMSIMNQSRYLLVEQMLHQMNFSNLSLSQKEQIIYSLIKSQNSFTKENARHVQLDDLLNATKSSRIDNANSFIADLKVNGSKPNVSLKFNQKLKLNDVVRESNFDRELSPKLSPIRGASPAKLDSSYSVNESKLEKNSKKYQIVEKGINSKLTEEKLDDLKHILEKVNLDLNENKENSMSLQNLQGIDGIKSLMQKNLSDLLLTSKPKEDISINKDIRMEFEDPTSHESLKNIFPENPSKNLDKGLNDSIFLNENLMNFLCSKQSISLTMNHLDENPSKKIELSMINENRANNSKQENSKESDSKDKSLVMNISEPNNLDDNTSRNSFLSYIQNKNHTGDSLKSLLKIINQTHISTTSANNNLTAKALNSLVTLQPMSNSNICDSITNNKICHENLNSAFLKKSLLVPKLDLSRIIDQQNFFNIKKNHNQNYLGGNINIADPPKKEENNTLSKLNESFIRMINQNDADNEDENNKFEKPYKSASVVEGAIIFRTNLNQLDEKKPPQLNMPSQLPTECNLRLHEGNYVNKKIDAINRSVDSSLNMINPRSNFATNTGSLNKWPMPPLQPRKSTRPTYFHSLVDELTHDNCRNANASFENQFYGARSHLKSECFKRKILPLTHAKSSMNNNPTNEFSSLNHSSNFMQPLDPSLKKMPSLNSIGPKDQQNNQKYQLGSNHSIDIQYRDSIGDPTNPLIIEHKSTKEESINQEKSYNFKTCSLNCTRELEEKIAANPDNTYTKFRNPNSDARSSELTFNFSNQNKDFINNNQENIAINPPLDCASFLNIVASNTNINFYFNQIPHSNLNYKNNIFPSTDQQNDNKNFLTFPYCPAFDPSNPFAMGKNFTQRLSRNKYDNNKNKTDFYRGSKHIPEVQMQDSQGSLHTPNSNSNSPIKKSTSIYSFKPISPAKKEKNLQNGIQDSHIPRESFSGNETYKSSTSKASDQHYALGLGVPNNFRIKRFKETAANSSSKK